MELDEMKTIWQETGARLARIEGELRQEREERRRTAVSLAGERSRSRLRPVRWVLGYEVASSVLLVLLAGSYLFGHLGELRFALPAAALHLAAILQLGAAVWQLVELGRIDYAGPVVASQRQLAAIALLRARSQRWLLLASPLLWALLAVVVPHGLVGLDVYRALGPAWVAANFVFGLAVLAAAAGIGRSAPDTSRAGAFLQRLGEDVTGRRVAAAAGELAGVASFAREG